MFRKLAWSLCALLLVSCSEAVKSNSKKAVQESKAGAKHTNPGKHHDIQFQMPQNAFVRIFALPSSEARAAQHRLGELLASSCKSYNRAGECKMYSAKVEGYHIRLLKFTNGDNSSVVAYMLQENDAEIEKALDTCVSDKKQDVISHENGGDYRCYETQAVKITSSQEVLKLVEDQLQQAGLFDQLKDAPRKSIFLTSDPKAIIFQEALRLTGDNKDPDHFTQKLRDSFRPIIEWLAWQFRQFGQLAKGTPMLYCHAEELDVNEQVEVNRVLEYMGIGSQAHSAKKTVTATLGEENYQRQKLKNDIATLPSSLSADIDEFLLETLQEKELVRRYIAENSTDRTALWPPKNLLHNVAFDNTLLVTAVTCEYAPLVVNWLKHLHAVQFPCYLVVALDETIYNFLHNWLPDHVVRAPPGFTDVMPKQFAASGSAAMRHLSMAQLNTIRAINKQGYNVAWSDADIAFTKNIFTVISRWWDFEATWMDGDETPLQTMDKTLGYELKFGKNDTRKISPSFLYFKGSENARLFIDNWHNASSASPGMDSGAILDQLLRDPTVNKKLNIQMLAEATFPPGQKLFEKQPAAFKKEWQSEAHAWAHPDHVSTKEGKMKSLSESFWLVVPEDPIPTCPKAVEDYLPNGTAIAKWPPGKKLESIAIDNTVLVTMATCDYAELVSNWIKRTWDLGISLFFVAGADQPISNFLLEWIPEHAAQMPTSVINQVSGFVKRNTSDYTKLLTSKPKVMRHILDQGYNVAWSDADVWWLKNPFTLFDRSPDLVLAWADSSGMLEGGVFSAADLLGKEDRQITTSFLFVKASSKTIMLMDAWTASLDGSSYTDDAVALRRLLLRDDFADLSLGIFPSPIFPSLIESTNSTSEELKAAWQDEALQPAWIHTDSLITYSDKISEFRRQNHWLSNTQDQFPKCVVSSVKSDASAKSDTSTKTDTKNANLKATGATASKSVKGQVGKKSKLWGKKKLKD